MLAAVEEGRLLTAERALLFLMDPVREMREHHVDAGNDRGTWLQPKPIEAQQYFFVLSLPPCP